MITSTFYSGVNCYCCGRFVGRDGHFNEEFFEMSNTLASLDGECAACLRGRCPRNDQWCKSHSVSAQGGEDG